MLLKSFDRVKSSFLLELIADSVSNGKIQIIQMGKLKDAKYLLKLTRKKQLSGQYSHLGIH